AAVHFQNERFDRGMLLLALALEPAERVDDDLAEQIRLELAQWERKLFRLALVLPTKEEVNGFSPDSRLVLTLAPDWGKRPAEDQAFVRLGDVPNRKPFGMAIKRVERNRIEDRYGFRAVTTIDRRNSRSIVTRIDEKTLQLWDAASGKTADKVQ